MKGEIIGYNADDGQLIIRLSTIKDNDIIPLGKTVEIVVEK